MADQVKIVLNSHTVCRGPDGKVKWEADTVPIECPVGLRSDADIQLPLVISTTDIKTGREHL